MTAVTNIPCNSALMLSQGLLASHFTRAEQLQILSPEGNVIATLANPAAAEGCHGKQGLLDALAHHQVGQVVVRRSASGCWGACWRPISGYCSAALPGCRCPRCWPLPICNLSPRPVRAARLAVIRASRRSVPSSL